MSDDPHAVDAVDGADHTAADAGGFTDEVPRWHRSTKIVVAVAFSVGVVALVYLSRNALTLVAMAGLIAFLVAPLIRVLQRRARFPKILALLLSYLVFLIAVVLVGGLIVAGIAASVSQVDPAEAAESLQETAVDALTAVRTLELGDFGLDLTDVVDPAIERLTSTDTAADGAAADGADADGADDAQDDEEVGVLQGGPGTTLTIAGEQVNVLLGGLLSSVQVLGGVLTTMVVTFLIALYLSADSHRFHAGLLTHVPPAYVHDAVRVNDRIARVWRGYLYGQLINSLATGLLVGVVLWAVGLPGAFVLGLIMAVLNMIPTFGPIIAAVPGVLTAIALGSTRLDWGIVSFALLVVGIYIVVVQLQANLMGPFITGQAVQMAPATILIGLIVGFQVGGLVGSLLVVPVLATFKEIARYVVAKLLDRDPFPPSDGADGTDEPDGRDGSDGSDGADGSGAPDGPGPEGSGGVDGSEGPDASGAERPAAADRPSSPSETGR